MAENNSELMRALGRIEGKLENIQISLQDHTGRMNRIDEDVEDVRGDVKGLRIHLAKQVEGIKEDVADVKKKQYALFFVGGVIWSVGLAVFNYFNK